MRARRRTMVRRLYWSSLMKIKGGLFMALLFMGAGALVSLLKPWPMKVIIDHVLLAKKMPKELAFLERWAPDPLALLWLSAGTIVAISMLGGLFSYLEVFITKAIGFKMVYDLRRRVFSHLQRLSLSFHNRARSGDLLTTFAKDTHTLKDVFAETILDISDQLVSIVGMLAIMWWVNWRMCLVAAAAMPFLAVSLLHLYRKTKLSLRKQRKQEGTVTSRMNEVLGAVSLVQAFSREKHEEDRYNEVSEETLRESIRMSRLEAASSRTSQFVTATGTAATLLIGAKEVLDGRMSPGDLVLIMSYVSSMYRPLRSLAKVSLGLSKAHASAERIAEVLDEEPEIKDLPGAIEADHIRGEITFASVSFDYGDGKHVLHRVSFDVKPGQTLALVGVSGAGKSTIASLLLRLYQTQSGAILIDGLNIERYQRESLRRQIGIVLQQSVLFGASIRENIAYGKPDATMEEIENAARAANAHEFIRELENGYESIVGERGVTLSAGQRQRMALARTIIRDPQVLILDEPLTGLDPENAAKVSEALERMMRGKTTIMITHDLAAVASADAVAVIEHGRIVERGDFKELMSRNGRYRQLYDIRHHALPTPTDGT